MSISSHLVQNLGSIILFSGSRALDQLNNLGIRDLAKVVIVHTDGHEGIGGFEADDVIGLASKSLNRFAWSDGERQ